ncbi:MAG: 50S ribosomal protein L35 [Candidatus Kerfeldbacteria bacterium CG15_BIG_FIL_POST_REV_8_21_14_020_45_12]|uniref:50S ribosomal protein L35 n=1 Tax=Candidatus Kerfeldbacteria bacterium CG15_BIG_FIL_POST_REV_8_21_14_020_45_12 TaxID=2014247 RepID=A0A2M7H335_9BACT|nr:MAG: 50S ribosomal protein L35 [Candidatus Kerfeldbacteria bacterium CG15_BIG_FIL_POST_REV_8_21_14_020_45_12]PJA93366.1 MAG: 50S ribosomal protein L35 [Candidatus Kerfeldbacteria bacterium CG_4_9_14_3_um_filter_45_8]
MAKLKKKTHKAISKRIKRTNKGKKSGKVTIRKAGQDHFNARESGKKMRSKRRDRTASKGDLKNIERLT